MRRWLWLFLAALALRWGTALLTERFPVFPDYYYTDARLYDSEARAYAQAWREGKPAPFPLASGREVYTHWAAGAYVLFGHRPVLLKLWNGLLGAGAVLCLGLLTAALAGEPAGLLAGALLACWPTHVFYTSQNLKEAWMLFLLTAGFLLALRSWKTGPRDAAAGAALLLASALFRSHILPPAALALMAGSLWTVWRERSRRALAPCLLLAAALAAQKPLSAGALSALSSGQPASGLMALKGQSVELEAVRAPFLSPRWVGEFRRLRQSRDQDWTRERHQRRIQTQILPDADIRTWGDLLLFLPRAAFHTLLMPLPGLYPLEGSLGRTLSALENLAVLALVLLALPGLLRGGPAGLALGLFFALVWLASAPFEYDLGSAARHKLQFLPFLLPFSAAALLRRLEKPDKN